jgi:hypothetical protein
LVIKNFILCSIHNTSKDSKFVPNTLKEIGRILEILEFLLIGRREE